MEHLYARLRSTGMKTLIAMTAAAMTLGAATFAPFPHIPPYLPVPTGAAVMMLTGSTNTTGYRIVVTKTGAAEFVAATGRGQAVISTELAAKLFDDLAAAAPLDQILSGSCMKPASFATSLFIYWNHQRSPDLTCLASDRGKALADDIGGIATQLHLGMSLRGVMRPILPGEQHHPIPTST